MTTLESPRSCSRFCVGLSGGIASGKSTVAQLFADLGAAIVDTDVIAHQLTRHNGAAMPAIAAAFGAAFVNQDGSLNRVAMRARVFANPSERQRLETILHPMINAETRAQGASVAGDYVMFVVPLLVESA
jgi:dephospho-CoA kinase